MTVSHANVLYLKSDCTFCCSRLSLMIAYSLHHVYCSLDTDQVGILDLCLKSKKVTRVAWIGEVATCSVFSKPR